MLVWTECLNVSKSMRIQLKTYWCGRGLNWLVYESFRSKHLNLRSGVSDCKNKGSSCVMTASSILYLTLGNILQALTSIFDTDSDILFEFRALSNK